MKKLILTAIVLVAFSACEKKAESTVKTSDQIGTGIKAEKSEKIENLLGTPETISLNGKDFKLSWSAQPSANYYKQEYITVDDTLEKYRNMLGI